MESTLENQAGRDTFRLELPTFEGPLDLLLHLIQTHELEIEDLPMGFVTAKYLEYLDVLDTMKLDLASEYLVMAATLTYIKSKTLLPPAEVVGGDDDDAIEVDPRAELVRKLLEYQKYKNAGQELAARGVQGRDIFLRGSPAPKAEGVAPLGNMTLFSLLDAFQRVLKKANAEFAREISAERITIQERMSELVEMLADRERVRFEDLFEGYAARYDYVVTFLALLEMAKTRLVRFYQSEPCAPIYLEKSILKVDAEPDDSPAGAPDSPALASDAGASVVAQGATEPGQLPAEHGSGAEPDAAAHAAEHDADDNAAEHEADDNAADADDIEEDEEVLDAPTTTSEEETDP